MKPAPDALSRVLDGEAVLLHVGSGAYYGLNEVGSFIWQRLGEGATVREIREGILERFDVDADTAHRDLDELLAQLEERGLIVREPDRD